MGCRICMCRAVGCTLCGSVTHAGARGKIAIHCDDRLLLKHVDQDADLREQLGAPVRIGRWYNAMVSVRPGGMAANCSLSLSGTQHDANATIQVRVRACNAPSSLPVMCGDCTAPGARAPWHPATFERPGGIEPSNACLTGPSDIVLHHVHMFTDMRWASDRLLSSRSACPLPQISRRPSPHHSVLLYQLLGPAEWDVVAVNAMVSKGKAERVYRWLRICNHTQSAGLVTGARVSVEQGSPTCHPTDCV